MIRFSGPRLRLPLLVALAAALIAGCSGDDSPAAAPSNAAPRLADCAAAPPTLAPGGVSTFSVTATDEDGDTVQVDWSVDAGAFMDGSRGETVRWMAPAVPATVQVIATATDGNKSVSDTLEVRVVTDPVLYVAPTTLDFALTGTSLSFDVSNPGTGTLDWTAAADAAWLSLDPASGAVSSDPDVVDVVADRAELAPGDHAAVITVASSVGEARVDVTLSVPAPVLDVTPAALDFGETETVLGLIVSNTGTGALEWTASSGSGWLSAAPASGVLTDETAAIVVTADRTGLAPGNHSAVLRLDSNAGTVDVPVTLRIATPDPVLGLSTSRLDFGDAATERLFQIANDGGGTLEWILTTDAPWLDFSPTSGTTTGEQDLITVTADRTGLAAGRHTASLVVTANPDIRTLDVTLDVSDGPVVLRNLFFLHHSTGRNLINEGDVRAELAGIDPSLEFWDHDYNDPSQYGLTNPSGVRLGESYYIPNDNTDPDGLHFLWTTANTARLQILQNHQVIAFKSCYPASNITSDAMLEQYKTWYREIRAVLDQYPDHVFVIMSQPPRHRLRTNTAEATRARAFADWLGSAEFLDGHPNLRFFDFFDYLAKADDGSSTANMLKYDYERYHENNGDSHPNAAANADVGPHFAAALAAAAGG